MAKKNMNVAVDNEAETKVVAGEEIMDTAETNSLGFVVKGTATKKVRSLSGTAALQAVAAGIATNIFNAVSAESNAKELVANSAETHYAMDSLVMTFADLSAVNIDFLFDMSDAEIAAMQKSQASKRSRCKASEMTMDNYMSLMNACICELLIRRVTGKAKGIRSGGGRRGTRTTLTYTEEQLVALADNQEEVRREIRNLASKKSIYKHSDDFDETSERWAEILEAEEQLKSIKSAVPAGERKPRTNKLKTALVTLFAENYEETMTREELLEFVSKIQDLLVPVATDDETPGFDGVLGAVDVEIDEDAEF